MTGKNFNHDSYHYFTSTRQQLALHDFYGGYYRHFLFLYDSPTTKEGQDQKKFVEEVKKGDLIVTIGGAYGRIAEIEDDTFIIEFERGARIKFAKSSVSMESTKAANSKKAST